jgi:hypothetical protein
MQDVLHCFATPISGTRSGPISGKIFCGAVASKSHALMIANRRMCFLFMPFHSPLSLNEKQNSPHNGGPNEEVYS